MELDLKNKEWKEFLIGDVFNIGTGALLSKKLLKRGSVARITATDSNNGVFDYYSELKHENFRTVTNFISVSFLGSVFYHPYKASLDMKIHSVKLKGSGLNEHLAHFIVLALKRITSVFSYGNQLSSSDLPKKKILLPVNSKAEPDFEFMEVFIKQKNQEKLEVYYKYVSKRIEELKNLKTVEPLEEKEWGEFVIGKLFTLSQGKSKGLNHLSKSQTGVNYLGATNLNNGVLCRVIKNDSITHKGNAIAFIRNGEGSMGYSIYKAEDFIATSDISVGYNQNLNRHVGTFITTIADKVRGKYNFGYKRSGKRLMKEKIMLPVNKKNKPDYAYMEKYMKQLEYKKLNEYLMRKSK